MHELLDVVNGIGICFICWLVFKLQFTFHNTCSASNAKHFFFGCKSNPGV
jgi:hypothetical protein